MGTKNTPREIKKKCYNCGCKFVYDENDIQRDRDGRYIECPQCGSYISVC